MPYYKVDAKGRSKPWINEDGTIFFRPQKPVKAMRATVKEAPASPRPKAGKLLAKVLEFQPKPRT